MTEETEKRIKELDREAAVEIAKTLGRDVTGIKFHCDGCPDVMDCIFSFNLFNAHGKKIADKGCLRDKWRAK